ncbi:cytochrome-c peroxidase [Nostoc sp. WHI]|uniref:cytochrome-c peroxidase n=1 Tax=Nostoc sp. WHI TaxID=2650611 RepID=UPI0018C5657B|nr:cytochrome c peroxidase [Nostoc sp. WHI]MBG1270480.1 cytochrome C peroxidase [Nostoc sp. WHI]
MTSSNFIALAILVVLVLALFGIYLKFKTRIASRYSRPLAIFVIVSLVTAGGGIVSAQIAPIPFSFSDVIITSAPAPLLPGDPTPTKPQLLSTVAVPAPSNLGTFVVAGQENIGLLQLGKSLFWDQQLGSDGIQSCGSCHFNAGADSRSKNQISPGLLVVPTKDITFQLSLSPNKIGGPNYQLTKADFPFHKLQDPTQIDGPNNLVISDTNDVASSQGVFNTVFRAGDRTNPGNPIDTTTSERDPNNFVINGINVRRAEPRNTPTTINAIFNNLQFWDGRAKQNFNGVDATGSANPPTPIFRASARNRVAPYPVAIDNSSLASLATEPPLSENELSATGRTLPQIGSKFFRKRGQLIKSLRPLGQQLVANDDSVLGPVSRFPGKGLLIGAYDRLIRQTFNQEWWMSNLIIETDSDGKPTVTTRTFTANGNSEEGVALPANEFSLRDWNFSLFAGLALQKYMSTLVADQTPFDKFQAGDPSALTEDQKKGLNLFVNDVANGGANCNTCHTIPEFTRASARRSTGANLTDLTGANGANIGFFTNYGVAPAANDPGAGSAAGSIFKAPTLRNIGLTAPFMHNGGMGTLEEVVQFYNRGRSDETRPGQGVPIVRRGPLLGLDTDEQADLVAFLRYGLTDKRVALEQAPFDHPQIDVPNGHPGNQNSVTASGNTDGFPKAVDQYLRIPQAGRNGIAVAQPEFFNTLPQ